MLLDKDQISQKLAQLEEYISQIRKYGREPESGFTADSMVEAAAERAIYKAAAWDSGRRDFIGIYLSS